MISISGNIWEEIKFNSRQSKKISQDYNLNSILSSIITEKKYDKEEIFSLNNKIDLINPFLKDVDFINSKNLLIEFIKYKKKIFIIGDYDVDGSVATGLLIKFFKNIQHPYDFYIPDRTEDGYGISEKLFKKLKNRLTELIVIVDSGSKSKKAIDYLNKINVKSVIIDHHEVIKPYPNSNVFINPKKNRDINHSNLCASALVYFLIDILKKHFKIKIHNKSDLFLTALATVCDVMPLRGLNRSIILNAFNDYNYRNLYFVDYFLKQIKKNNKLEYDDFGYLIGPILNSGGRLNMSNLATKLIVSTKKEEIEKISNTLIDQNNKRKEIEKKIINKIDNDKDLIKINDTFIIIKDISINEGFIGIIAARYKEKYNKTTIVFTQSKNLLKGSARSTTNINIGSIINNAVLKNIMINGGGHKMAAGFSMNKKNFNLFIKFLKEYPINKQTNSKKYISKISSSAININFVKDLEKLAPFGNDNKRPIFLIENLIIKKPKIINDLHIHCLLKDKKNKFFNSIIFNANKTKLGDCILNYKKEIKVLCEFKLYGTNNNKISTHIVDIII